MISLYGSLWGILLLIIKFTPTSAPALKQTFAERNKPFNMGVIDTTGLQLHNYTAINMNQMCSSMFVGSSLCGTFELWKKESVIPQRCYILSDL